MRLLFLFILFTFSIFSENTTQIDQLPNSCTCTIEKDAQGRAVKKEIKDPNEEIVYLEEISYNESNLTIADYAYQNGVIRHTGVSFYEKNDQELVTKRILGVGTDNEQIAFYTYTDSGKILTVRSPNGVIIHHKYDEDENLTEIKSSDGTIHYTIDYIDNSAQQTDHINHQTIIKQFAKSGYLAKEIFPNGQEIHYEYEDGDLAQIHFLNNGSINYLYDDEDNLIKVKRCSSDGRMLYEHSYMDFDDEGDALKETLIYDLGEIVYEEIDETTYSIRTPYSLQKLHIEPSCISVTIDGLERIYPLDKIGQLQVDGGFDSLGNPIKAKINSRNELLEYKDINCQYDLNGNLIKKITPNKIITYNYDALYAFQIKNWV